MIEPFRLNIFFNIHTVLYLRISDTYVPFFLFRKNTIKMSKRKEELKNKQLKNAKTADDL